MLVSRKVGADMRDSVWQLIIDTLSQFQIYDRCRVNKSNMEIELPNKSLFLFKGLDDSERLKSINGLTDIWMEEADAFTLEDFSQLNLRLRAKDPNLQMYLSYNPSSKQSWVYSYWGHDGITEPPKDSMVLLTTYKDNKFLPQSYIDTLEDMKNTNYTRWLIYAKGEFATLDKLIYNHTIEDFDYHEVLKQENTTAIFGLDWGYTNDPTAFVASVIDDINKILYIFDEHSEKGMLNNQIAGMIIGKGYSKEIIICDSAEPKSLAEIKKHGITRAKRSYKGKGSVLNGIQQVQQYQIIVHPDCENVIVELENYSWKKDKQSGEYMNTPINDYDHILDALRYSLQSIKSKGKVKIFDKSLLGL